MVSALTGANSSKSITAVGAARIILEKGFIDFLPYRWTLENRDVGLPRVESRRSYATISIRLSSLRQQACFDAAVSGPSLGTIPGFQSVPFTLSSSPLTLFEGC